MNEKPLVTCIMPTRDRRQFVPQAIAYFQAQDYPNRELVIVDDGRDPIEDLVPDDRRIRYMRGTRRLSIGAKRNLACRAAGGDLVAHWDDDDWMASWRLSYQVERLLGSHADVCGLDRVWFLELVGRRAWQYVYPTRRRPWVVGGTMCYRKSFWKRQPFAEINVGEDNRFLARMDARRLLRLDDDTFYVGLIHPRNTSPKRTHGPRWERRPLTELEKLLGPDRRFYSGLATRSTPKRRPPSSRPARGPQPRRRPTHRSRAVPPPADQPHVLAALPYYGCDRTLRRAATSVLGQTWKNLTLVVLNDGGPSPWHLLEDIDDPRLVRFDLERNRGRYFADAVALAATDSPFFLVQDADDWSEPHRIATLMHHLERKNASGAVSAIRRCRQDASRKRATVEHYPSLDRPLTPKLLHRASHTGLFRTEALREVGGQYGGFRIGYDTFLMSLLLMVGRLAYVDEPLYNCLLRSDSLTRSPRTGMRSPARQEAHRLLHAMYADTFRLYTRRRGGELDLAELGRRIREISRRHVDPEAAAALRSEAARLRPLLRQARRAGATPPMPLDDPRLRWSGWTITRTLARDLQQALLALAPRCMLEVGSGLSTLVLADHVRRSGARLVTLEHEKRWFEETDGLLKRFGLRDRVDLRLAPIEPFACPDGARHPWFSTQLSGRFDFVLVDGPPRRVGREAVLFALAPHLADTWEVWLNDALRPHEQRCVELWSQHLEFESTLSRRDERGLLRLSGGAPPAPPGVGART